jgi:hypothetical protein
MADDSAHGVPQPKVSGKFTDNSSDDDVPRFSVPVDSENKSKVLKIWSFGFPHHLCFHLNWLSFMLAFFATFAAPPMMPVIRDDLDLTKQDIGGASIASVTGAVFSRILLGAVCDSYGPRYGHGVLQLLTASATFGIAAVSNSAGFIACRMLIGFSLATFVACQFWWAAGTCSSTSSAPAAPGTGRSFGASAAPLAAAARLRPAPACALRAFPSTLSAPAPPFRLPRCSVMFTAKIVGTANAVAAGWGNMGAGLTHLIMPYILSGLEKLHPNFVAWRVAYFIPGWCQVLIGLAVLVFGQDLPDGEGPQEGEEEGCSEPTAGRLQGEACPGISLPCQNSPVCVCNLDRLCMYPAPARHPVPPPSLARHVPLPSLSPLQATTLRCARRARRIRPRPTWRCWRR